MKLVGTFRAVVTDVDKGKSAKGKDVLKVSFDVTDEWINSEWMPMQHPVKVVKHYSLSTERKPGSQKCGAEVTAEQIKASFDHIGGFSKLGDLVFKVAHLICEEHEGRFTQIQYVNHPDKKGAVKLEEFSDSIQSELERIFASVA